MILSVSIIISMFCVLCMSHRHLISIIHTYLSDLISMLGQKRQEKAPKLHMKEINKYVCMGAHNYVLYMYMYMY